MKATQLLLFSALGREAIARPKFQGRAPQDTSESNNGAQIGKNIDLEHTLVDSLNLPPEGDPVRGEAHDGREALEHLAQQVKEEWKNKTCVDDGVTDANMPSKERWQRLGTTRAFDFASDEWLKAKDAGQTHIKYVQWISNMFHGPEGMDCGNIANDACTQISQCDDVSNPSAYFLINSFSTIHQLAQSSRNEMGNVRDSISVGTFMEKFCPKKSPDMALEIFKVIIDTVLAASMVGSAFLWNRAIKPVGAFTSDVRGSYKDTMNAGMSYAYNVIKDTKKGPKDMTEATNRMEEQMKIYFGQMQEFMDETNKFLFSGEKDGINSLREAIDFGNSLPNNNLGIDVKDFGEELKSIVFSKMIPQAWYLNPEDEHIPLVLETDDKCDGSDRPTTGTPITSGETIEQTRVCIDGTTYYVLGTKHMEGCKDWEACESEGKDWFHILPGGSHDELDGKKWGKITLEDIVRSVRDGFVRNGNKNGYQPPEDPDTGDLNAWFDGLSIRMPGFWNVPFCPKDRWNEVVNKISGYGVYDEKFWPCGE